MSSPGRNIDPRAKRYDMSNDVTVYTADRFDTIDKKISELPEIFNDEGETKNGILVSRVTLRVLDLEPVLLYTIMSHPCSAIP